jgi:hypothetical protein
MATTTIYILRLENNKYYIGKSNDVTTRYNYHISGKGSAWTRKYKPISIEKTIPGASVFDEDKVTKQYMAQYGIDNVRGGSYVEVTLDDNQIESLKKEIWGAQDKCTNCGRTGHFVKDCYAKTDVSGNIIDNECEWECEYCSRMFQSEYGCMVHERTCKEKDACYRCGRQGHYASDCYARRHIDGCIL